MKRTLLIILKIFVTTLVIVFLYKKISEDTAGFASAFQLFSGNILVLLVVIVLMPLNWLMEVLKWKLAIQPITNISTRNAVGGVLAGVALGFVTPHAVGDYFAKVFSIAHQDREKALGLILISRMMQMLPTAIFGAIALYVYSRKSIALFDIPFSFAYLLLGGLFLLVLTVMLVLRWNHPKIRSFVAPIQKVSLKLLSALAALSIIRYLIFSAQFLLLLSVVGLKISVFKQFMGIAFMFLAKSILPTFNFLSDLGVREFSVALFFESFEVEVAPVIASGLILWLINIALPALMGIFYIPQLQLKKS